MSHAAPFPLLNHNHESSSRQQNSNQIKLPTVGQSPSPAHHEDFKSEVESELDFDDNFAEEEVDLVSEIERTVGLLLASPTAKAEVKLKSCFDPRLPHVRLATS